MEERVDLLLGSPLSYDVGSVPTKCRSSGSTPCANYPEVCCPVNYECCPDETGQVKRDVHSNFRFLLMMCRLHLAPLRMVFVAPAVHLVGRMRYAVVQDVRHKR